jgi:hypothetical protein
MNAELEKWIESHQQAANSTGDAPAIVFVDDLRALFDGKVLIDANKDASCEAAMEHELSIMQSTLGSYKSPGEALRALIDWHCAVAVDPKVNGGKVLVPVGLIDEAVKALTPVVKCRTYFFDERATVGLKVLVEAMIAASQEQNNG